MQERKRRLSTRDIERHSFELFQNDYELPAGTICFGDKPDVVVKGQRNIGIELTNLYLRQGADPGSEQRQRNLRERTVATAQRLHQDEGGKKLELSFGFSKTSPITNGHFEK